MTEHAPQNALTDAGEIARFHDRCSDLMRELLDALSETPDRPRTFPSWRSTTSAAPEAPQRAALTARAWAASIHISERPDADSRSP